MAEGGNAEKFPDEWVLQFLGNTIISQLSSGIPSDFLINRYILLFFILLSILLLKFQISLIQKIFVNFSFRIFLSYQSRKALLETELGSTLDFSDSCGCPPLMVPTLGPLTLTVPLSEEENLLNSLCKFNFSYWTFLIILFQLQLSLLDPFFFLTLDFLFFNSGTV